MIIDTKFDIGERVYLMHNNVITEFTIVSIRVNIQGINDEPELGLITDGKKNKIYRKASLAFATIDKLLDSMR